MFRHYRVILRELCNQYTAKLHKYFKCSFGNTIIEAQPAKIYNNFKNTSLNLLKTTAAIWFNKICKTNTLIVNCTTNSCN